MKILVIYDSSGPKFHRCLLPAWGLQQYHYAQVIVKATIKEDDVKDVDFILFNRLIPNTKVETLIAWREKYGFKMICDMDDHWRLGKDHVLYLNYQKHDISGMIELFIKHSDLVFVTHERLLFEIIPINRNCHILPNAIPKIDQFLVNKVPSDDIRLFWAGGVTHRKDLELIERPMQLIKGSKFIIAGYDKNDSEWKQIANMFNNYGTTLIESAPVNQYYQSYSLCDIALAPLLSTTFNRFKSNLKVLEAANIGAPIIVSQVHPYLDLPVIYADNWYKQMTSLIKSEELRIDAGLKLKEYCDIHYNFSKINLERKQILDDAIEQKHIRATPTEALFVD